MSFHWLKKDSVVVKLLLATLSAVLLTIPWTWGASFTLFFAFIPLLVIDKMSSRKAFFLYGSYTIILWHLLSVIWIAKASVLGVYASTLVNLFYYGFPLQVYSYTRRKGKKTLAYILLVSGLLAMEYLNIANEEITWPWLVIGNGFASSHTYVQWYEYTGVLGGSLWVFIVNILLFEFFTTKKRQHIYWAMGIISLGVISSKLIYMNYVPSSEKVKVAIIQPNFDPYFAKFTMGRTVQLEIVDSMLSTLPSDLDYIVMPETTFDEVLLERSIDNYNTVLVLKKRLSETCPNADMIMGSSTRVVYDAEEKPSPTARKYTYSDKYYDLTNSSLSINPSRDTDTYKKSKLVIGAEMLPFSEALSALGDLSVKLGGTSGVLLPQEQAEVFTHTLLGINSGGAVCYESVYGAYYSQFVNRGADIMFVITNDGWWADTYGYKQHFSFSRLRAIESRRDIGRSANTGISAFIDGRGDALQELGWWKRGILIGEMSINYDKTFYTKYGDYIGTVSAYVFVLLLLYSISICYKKKLLLD